MFPIRGGRSPHGRVRAVVGIVVPLGVGKQVAAASAALPSLVNMKGEYAAVTIFLIDGQPENFSGYKHSVFLLSEQHPPVNYRLSSLPFITATAFDLKLLYLINIPPVFTYLNIFNITRK